MNEIEKLYKKLEETDVKDFYEIEGEFIGSFHYLPNEKKSEETRIFVNVSNWFSNSLRSGVWTFYEVVDKTELYMVLEYLDKTGKKEFAEIFECGIHDYQNPKYKDNYAYPDEWIDGSEKIDDWIYKNEAWIWEWERKFLLKHKESICSLYK